MTDIDAFSALLQRNVSNVWPDEVMARHTGFRIGGQAKLYVECDTMDELVTTIEVAGECGLEWTIIGKGTNVLIADEGYDGIIMTLGREFKRHEVHFCNGRVIKSGDTVIVSLGRNRYEEAEFLYKDTRNGDYICKPIGDQRYKFPRQYHMVFANTEVNRKLLANR